MNPYQVLLSPMDTEKSNLARESDEKYSFFVNCKASRTDVKRAVELLYGVNVKKVNTSLLRGKMKRRGQNIGLEPKRKKAFVSLASGQKLPLFEEL
jgi:large subunit ribosomal protein L23